MQLRRSTRRLSNPDRKARNDLPDDTAPPSDAKDALGNQQTEPPGSEIMSTLKPAKQRKGKGGRKKGRRCKPRKKGKRKRCKPSKDELNDSSMACGRKAMTVDFEEIGWSDWIIAPHSFESYYCAGSCSVTDTKVRTEVFT